MPFSLPSREVVVVVREGAGVLPQQEREGTGIPSGSGPRAEAAGRLGHCLSAFVSPVERGPQSGVGGGGGRRTTRKQFSRGLQTSGKPTVSLLATNFSCSLVHSHLQPALHRVLEHPPPTSFDWTTDCPYFRPCFLRQSQIEKRLKTLLTCPQHGWKTTRLRH